MRILEYRGLDIAAVRPQYEKIRRLLEQEDFRAANSLFFRLVRWRGKVMQCREQTVGRARP